MTDFSTNTTPHACLRIAAKTKAIRALFEFFQISEWDAVYHQYASPPHPEHLSELVLNGSADALLSLHNALEALGVQSVFTHDNNDDVLPTSSLNIEEAAAFSKVLIHKVLKK